MKLPEWMQTDITDCRDCGRPIGNPDEWATPCYDDFYCERCNIETAQTEMRAGIEESNWHNDHGDELPSLYTNEETQRFGSR